MRITKFIHACLLVETPDRTALFDPGTMSAEALDVSKLKQLNDIFITHVHADHCDPELIKQLVAKFPEVRITGTPETVAKLAETGIIAGDQPPKGVTFFDSPHESVKPLFDPPQEIGIHYLDTLSDPGDSHSFHETKAILALPMTGPWGSSIKALNLALELKPQHVVPIHDWHWTDAAREQSYDKFESVLGEQGITFHKLQTGQPIQIDL
jgi:L-ascorbate metabolism protein UlaG (beta-lactamase superfamily)